MVQMIFVVGAAWLTLILSYQTEGEKLTSLEEIYLLQCLINNTPKIWAFKLAYFSECHFYEGNYIHF